MSSPEVTNQRAAVVLLPTYNEAGNIEPIIKAILAASDGIDIMVLDDASPDGTGRLAQQIADSNERVQVVHRPGKAGLGAAYRDGYARALQLGYQFVLQMDADFSHAPADIPRLLGAMAEADLVLGSRWVKGGGTRRWPWYRQVISRGGSLYTRLLLGIGIHDATGGFKCFRREVLAALRLDEVRSNGYAFQIEITYRALQAGFRVREIPIVFVEREEGISKMSKGIVLEALLNVPRLRWR